MMKTFQSLSFALVCFATQVLGEVDEQWQLAWESDRALILQRRID